MCGTTGQLESPIEKGVESKKKMPLDFWEGMSYAFYAVLSYDKHDEIENSEQGRKGQKKLAKMVKNAGNDEQEHGEAHRHDGGQRRRAKCLPQLGSGLTANMNHRPNWAVVSLRTKNVGYQLAIL